MTNPRSRNFLRLTPHAAEPAQLPAVNVVTALDAKQLADFSRAVKETLDVRHGRSGNPFERWVTTRDLSTLGLTGGLPADMPTDQGGVPVWTSQGRFALVTLRALAEALARLGVDDSASDAEELKRLRDRTEELNSKIGLGVSTAQLSASLDILRNTLVAQWTRDIDGASLALRRDLLIAVDAVRALAAQAAASATRHRGYVHEVTVAAAVWTVEHNLERYPLVTVWNSAGEKVEPDVTYSDENTVVITHGRAETGHAVFR